MSVKCFFHDMDLCMYALVLMNCMEGNIEVMGDSVNGGGLIVPLGDVFKDEPP